MKRLTFMMLVPLVLGACQEAPTNPTNEPSVGTSVHSDAPGFHSEASGSGAGQLLATTNQGNLVGIDVDAGTAQLIGDAGVFEGRDLGWTGLSFDRAGNLFVNSRWRSEFDEDCPDFGRACTHVYTIDPNTGAVVMEVGSARATFISDIDFGHDGTLYGSHWLRLVEPSGGGRLVTIDPTTALATVVGRYGASPFHGLPFLQNGALSVHPETGDIWGVESDFSFTPAIFKVDPVTGVASDIIRLGLGGIPTTFGLDALEILIDGRFIGLQAGPSSNLYEIDPTPDAGSGLAELTLVPLAFSSAIDGTLNGLEARHPIIAAELDIKPGSDPNSINCNDENVSIAVAILTTEDFDATTVDHTTVTFEGASETHVDKKSGDFKRHEEDVDDDEDTDLVFHFRLGDTNLTCNSEEGTLTGETFDGHAIEGADAVRMIDEGGGQA